jgi:glycosyltransferase involved in cell wall biosynthesis
MRGHRDSEALRRGSKAINPVRGVLAGLLATFRRQRGDTRLSGIDRVTKCADDSGRRDRRPVIWFEVEDFLRYFDHFPNPTGSQRVPFEIFVEAARLYGPRGRVRFCRLSVYTRQLLPIDFSAVKSAYANPPGASAPWKAVWEPAQLLSDSARMVPVVLGNPGFFFRIAGTAVRDFVERAIRPHDFETAVRPGDIVVTLGASWGVPGYAQRIAAAKERFGIRFAVLVYDMIPIENGDLVEQHHAFRFRQWLAEMAPAADVILTISEYSRRALLEFAATAQWSMPRIEVIRLGGELSPQLVARRSRLSASKPDEKLYLRGRYVLFVSTIEIRKNHGLLVRVWRRLIARHGADAVPVLIFAGQVGWMVDDLLADLAASDWLGGKVEHRPGLSDAELDEAYDGCLFTIFPSLCEGWGLPVAESLAHGKFCLASNRTSIPEVGGDLIDYFDPSDDDDAAAKIERLLFERGYLAARESRLRAEYRPGTWADCARSIVLKLQQPAEIAQAPPAGELHEHLAPAQPVGNP